MAKSNLVEILISARDEATEKLKSVGSSLNAFAGIGTAAVTKGLDLMATAARFAGEQLVSVVEAANIQEKAELSLAKAIANQGGNVELLTAQLKKEASALQAVTTAGDETTIGLQALAINMGISAEKAGDTVAAAVDLAAAMGIDARTAVVGLTKSLTGLLDRNLALVPGIKDLTTEQLKAGAAIDLAAAAFKGSAKETLTFMDRITQAKNALGDLAEQTGFQITKSAALNTQLELVTGFLADMAESDAGVALGQTIARGAAIASEALAGLVFAYSMVLHISGQVSHAVGDEGMAAVMKGARDDALDLAVKLTNLADKMSLAADNAEKVENKIKGRGRGKGLAGALAEASDEATRLQVSIELGGRALDDFLTSATGNELDLLQLEFEDTRRGFLELAAAASLGADEIDEGLGRLVETYRTKLGELEADLAERAVRIQEKLAAPAVKAAEEAEKLAGQLSDSMGALGLQSGIMLVQGIAAGIRGEQDALKSTVKGLLPIIGAVIGGLIGGGPAGMQAGAAIGGGIANLFHTGSPGVMGNRHTGSVALRENETFRTLTNEMAINTQAIQNLGGPMRVLAAQAGIDSSGGGDTFFVGMDLDNMRQAMRRGTLGREAAIAVKRGRGEFGRAVGRA